MVSVGHYVTSDSPSLVPLKVLFIDEDTHKFSDAQGGVSVVNMDSDFLIEFADIAAGADVVADNGLSAGRDEEVFLNEPHALTVVGRIIRVKVLGNGFDEVAILIFLAHLLMSKHTIIGEVAINFSIPQAQGIDCFIMISDDRDVIRNSHHGHGVFVHELERAVGLLFHVSVAIELDVDRLVRFSELPRESFISITPSCFILFLGLIPLALDISLLAVLFSLSVCVPLFPFFY